MACNETYVISEHRAFDFEWVHNVTRSIAKTCLADPRLVSPENPVLTGKACAAITGEDGSWRKFGAYPTGDVWQRFATWKLPLVQLLFQFQRPPLGWKEELFSMIHLWGDPMDTISSLLHTIAQCHARAIKIKQRSISLAEIGPDDASAWKAITLIAISFDECGRPDKAEEVIEKWSHYHSSTTITGTKILACYEDAAKILAADRATRFLPIVLAQVVFIAGFSIAFAKASSSPPSKGNWVNVEAHSIAFSANYFWAIPAVFLSALIGVSQSEANIPRILSRMNRDVEILETMNKEEEDASASDGFRSLSRFRSFVAAGVTTLVNPTVDERLRHGALYSWRPSRWRTKSATYTIKAVQAGNPVLFSLVAAALVACGTGTALIVSFRVPPFGATCRPIGHMTMLTTWCASYLVGISLSRLKIRPQMYFVLAKDLVALGITWTVILIVQAGVYNRCSCFTLGPDSPLTLPQDPDFTSLLMDRIKGEYLEVVIGGILFELLIVMTVVIRYNKAIRVFLQRDDGVSNIIYLRRASTYHMISNASSDDGVAKPETTRL